ncbi:MAG TPA: glycosyltransferase [Candidatus Krumholzibacterium sp.]|nr:glycosyltransferase [Candidatus Krumholzibacterium sp.]
MAPRRILIVSSSLGLGGAEKHIAALCRQYISRGAECSVLYPSSAGDAVAREISETGAGLIPFPISSLRQLINPSRLLALRGAAREFSPDAVHAHLYHGEVLGALCSLFTGAPLAATRHSSGLEFNGSRRSVIRLLRKRYRAVIAVSPEAASEAGRQGFARDIIHVIPNAVDTGLFRPLPGDERRARREIWERSLFGDAAGGPLIGTMGSLKKVKDHALLIEALSRVDAGGVAGPRLVVIGEGPERPALERLIDRSGPTGSVALPGTEAEPWNVLPLLDIFVLSSRSEGIPIALLEAMACGVACVSTEVGGIGEVLRGTGVLVPPGDAEAMARALSDLVSRPGEMNLNGTACRNRVLSSYGIESWGRATWEVLCGLRASAGGAVPR